MTKPNNHRGPSPDRKSRPRPLPVEKVETVAVTVLHPPDPIGDPDFVLRFGAYAGTVARAVPTPYLVWLVKKKVIGSAFREHVRKLLAARGHAPDGSDVIGFGRYNGAHLRELPLAYIDWLLEFCTCELFDDKQEALARQILAEAEYVRDDPDLGPEVLVGGPEPRTDPF